MEVKKQILKACMQKGFLLDKEILDYLSNFEESFSIKLIESLYNLKINDRVINKNIFYENKENLIKIFTGLNQKILLDNFFSIINLDKQKEENKNININLEKKNSIKIISSSLVYPKKVEVQDFVKHFKNRYEQIKNILQERKLDNLKSIRRISDERENQYIIVMIIENKVTKNKNLMFEVEDITGRSRILINNNKPELYEKCKDILPDEVLAFNVTGKRDLLFVNDVIFPDLFLPEKKKSNSYINIFFTSDVHVGSKMFL
jgi:DNA polymerase II small subunit/DNA polymerase delta subunit B